MYRDRACSDSLSDAVAEITAVTDDDCADDEAGVEVINDGECNFTGHCSPGNWANSSSASGAEEIWVGYQMDSSEPVGCISICQSRFDIQRVNEVILQRSSDEGATWESVSTITTETSDRSTATIFVVE